MPSFWRFWTASTPSRFKTALGALSRTARGSQGGASKPGGRRESAARLARVARARAHCRDAAAGPAQLPRVAICQAPASLLPALRRPDALRQQRDPRRAARGLLAARRAYSAAAASLTARSRACALHGQARCAASVNGLPAVECRRRMGHAVPQVCGEGSHPVSLHHEQVASLRACYAAVRGHQPPAKEPFGFSPAVRISRRAPVISAIGISLGGILGSSKIRYRACKKLRWSLQTSYSLGVSRDT
eukprot:5202958-Pleurochrysis_carterae.AAC.5